MTGAVIYGLCALTALACAYLLLQGYRRGGYRLLLWAGLCFVGLTFNNALLVCDTLIFPTIDFSFWRNASVLIGMAVLLYGLVWDTE
jgi:hypothetical protein